MSVSKPLLRLFCAALVATPLLLGGAGARGRLGPVVERLVSEREVAGEGAARALARRRGLWVPTGFRAKDARFFLLAPNEER